MHRLREIIVHHVAYASAFRPLVSTKCVQPKVGHQIPLLLIIDINTLKG